MNKKVTTRTWLKGAVSISLLLLGVLAYQRGMGATATATARLEQAWENVRFSANYAFAADIVIETIPLPTAGNIGRFSKSESLYLEGSNNLADNTLEMALWGGGISVSDRQNAYQVRAEDGRLETRTGNGEWQSGSDNTIAFAPEGDFLAFLDMAENVALAGDRVPDESDAACALLDCDKLEIYTFDLNVGAYAEKLRGMAEEQ